MQVINNSPTGIAIYPISEKAVTIEFGNNISEQLMHVITAFDQLLHDNPFPGLLSTVPAYTTLTVFFEPLQVMKAEMPGNTALDKVTNYITGLQETKSTGKIPDALTITIPICYGGEFGPDLHEVASTNGLTVEEVIKLHCSAIYLVHMIGFMPGFAYLGGMHQRIVAPRKLKPRHHVQAGSVGIAGMQTGIYPLQSPGGWQIIGRTPLKMFDVSRGEPSLLKAGDRVKFEPISEADFINHREN